LSAESRQAQEERHKEWLVKSARMYAMCQNAGTQDPLLPVSLALAAFEEVPLKEATAFIRTNRPNLEDMAWALTHSGSPKEFEEKLQERLAAMKRRQEPGGKRRK
jgi:hypothetical protein